MADFLEKAKDVLRTEADAVLALIDRINGDFRAAVEMILACEGRVVITGMGKSGLICQKIAATMASTGTPALFLHPAEGVHGDLGMLMKGDVVIAVSNSGETGGSFLDGEAQASASSFLAPVLPAPSHRQARPSVNAGRYSRTCFVFPAVPALFAPGPRSSFPARPSSFLHPGA